MQILMQQLQALLTALLFLTRLPLPPLAPGLVAAPGRPAASARYMPLVGLLLGALGGILFQALSYLWPLSISLLLSMALLVLLTGALHEDGLADFFDGIGSGAASSGERAEALRRMRDPSTGVFGALALLFSLLLQFTLLYEIGQQEILAAMISAHGLSRLGAITLAYTHPYLPGGRSGYLLKGIAPLDLLLAALPVLAVLLGFYGVGAIPILAISATALLLFALWLKYRLGGYSGDCLGAAQQILQSVVYLTLLPLHS